ncbi:hypothetical protein H2200_011404 [Cladophialophora chaetospira]|uniref:Uncharacterized protein n=1 Tax=Cladophialophora chaetospira TaxID=386627 RepID=A0AA38WZ87_9EURO|nr:hypothetical protein H2200_011404 [Cladophialophora chaetospira]
MNAIRDTRADVPPKDEVFYEKVNKSAANLQWFGGKFAEAMGVTPNMYEAMFNTADRALPAGKAMNFTNAGNRAIRDAAAQRVLADPTVGRYFQRSFSAINYPHAYEFFQKAPTKLVMVANNVRRGKFKDLASASTESEDEEVSRHKHGLYNNDVVGSQQAPSPMAYRPFKADTPPTTYAPHMTHAPPETLAKKEASYTPQETGDARPQDTQGTRNSFHILKPAAPNVLEIMSLRYGFPVAVDMTAAFRTQERTPKPEELNIAIIRGGTQTVREKRGLPNMLNEYLKFKFFWIESDVAKELEVHNDDTLRAAYRVWLAAEDVCIPFVLCVDDTDVEGAWVNGRMLTEGGR